MAMIANGIDRTSPQYIPPAMSAPFEAEAIRTFGIKNIAKSRPREDNMIFSYAM